MVAVKSIVVEPTWKLGIFVPPQVNGKARCFIKGYDKYFGSHSHERQWVVLDYVEVK